MSIEKIIAIGVINNHLSFLGSFVVWFELFFFKILSIVFFFLISEI